jgi:diaminopimelate decarboxylase
MMEPFSYRDGVLHCEEVPIPHLAEVYGTPLYVYSQQALLQQLHALTQAFAAVQPLICYSVKSNPNLHICRLLAQHGTGFDVTSGGELYRALEASGSGSRIVFAGVGKTEGEMRAALAHDVLLFNVESEAEWQVLSEVARQVGQTARAALRVNPDLPPKTHRKTDTSVKGSKFGLDVETVVSFAAQVVRDPYVRLCGLHMHLGSPILTAQPYQQGVEKALRLLEQLRRQGHAIEYINMGGGFGISYRKQEAPPVEVFAQAIVPAVKASGCRLILEPGRFLVGNSGILVSRVLYTKESGGRHFLIQDAAMNDLIRPTLYEAFHRIWPVQPPAGFPAPPEDFEAALPGALLQDVVGPVCESGDFLAQNRWLPPLTRGALLATFSTGAYGMSMSSNYNGRPRAAEVLVHGSQYRLIRRRETYDDLVRPEREV